MLVLDEVHGYDEYINGLIAELLSRHAAQGGHAVLLSATLPLHLRQRFVEAWQQGLITAGLASGATPFALLPDYPLTTQAGVQGVHSQPCATRASVQRTVQVQHLDSEQAVLAVLEKHLQQGQSVCWIRNTVHDALHACQLLRAQGQTVQLLHSRFTMHDRLRIEEQVLHDLGKHSGPTQRRGKVLLGTQILQESLDYDVDCMVSDLAPMDLLIQRAGRLQRHLRAADGTRLPASASRDGRPAPVLYLYGPAASSVPDASWYKALFPRAAHVYPHHGRLWLTQQALLQAGCIITPGSTDQPGAVRNLIEAVYGDAAQFPPGLQQQSMQAEGEEWAAGGLAKDTVLGLASSYSASSARNFWEEEAFAATRLGDESTRIFLACLQAGRVQPLHGWVEGQSAAFAWEKSALRLRAGLLAAGDAALAAAHAEAIRTAQRDCSLLDAPALLLLMQAQNPAVASTQQNPGWIARGSDAKGRALLISYNSIDGLMLSKQ